MSCETEVRLALQIPPEHISLEPQQVSSVAQYSDRGIHALIGPCDGACDGPWDGPCDGPCDGPKDCLSVGIPEGSFDGATVGIIVESGGKYSK